MISSCIQPTCPDAVPHTMLAYLWAAHTGQP
jgi:hypothetical protein